MITWRGAGIGAAATLAVLMVGWTGVTEAWPMGWGAAVRDPPAHDGEEMVLSLFTVERVDGPDRYVLRKASWRVDVVGDTAGLRVGEDLSIGGTFRAADVAVVEAWREPAPLRDEKRWLGIAGVLATLVLLPVWFRVRDGRLEERSRA